MTMDAAVSKAVHRVTSHAEFSTKFKHPVKFNGTDFVEQRLTAEQQLEEVSKIAIGSMHIFLERYGTMLERQDLIALQTTPASQTAEARFWFERLLKAPPSSSDLGKQKRRRRYVWAKREMAKPNGFFSEEEMKDRDPQLYHKLIGQYQNSGASMSAPMQGSLSGYLLQQLEKDCDAEAAAAAGVSSANATGSSGQKRQHDDLDDEECEDLDDDMDVSMSVPPDSGNVGGIGSSDDLACKRAKFLKIMRNRFILGSEDYKYSIVDSDSDLDDVVEIGRDAEDKYFGDD
eukprot:TRINITY_DN22690_c0_g1_i1.p1 TRINITY_DN22690_c0_g1~~TRINITY_DN22690_c0_g1_i1.p1  ORF type:complete len:288 (+),score=79.73 TRINITY_DN22690_c0_g1_i1:149-1012(+)